MDTILPGPAFRPSKQCGWYHSLRTLYNAGNWQITIFPLPIAKSESIILLKGQLNKIEVFLKFAMYDVCIPPLVDNSYGPSECTSACVFTLGFGLWYWDLSLKLFKTVSKRNFSIKVWSKWNWYQITRYVNYKLYSWLALRTSTALVKDLPNIFSHSSPVESSANCFFTSSKAFCCFFSFKQRSLLCKFRQRRACFRIVADKPSVEVFLFVIPRNLCSCFLVLGPRNRCTLLIFSPAWRTFFPSIV